MTTIKACYLDANVLFYLHDRSAPAHESAKQIIEELVSQQSKLVISSLTLDEFLHSAIRFSGQHIAAMKHSLSLNLRRLFQLPGIELVNPPLEAKKHYKVVKYMAKYNLRARDAYHLFLMTENKVKFLATFNSDFKEVFGQGLIKRIN